MEVADGTESELAGSVDARDLEMALFGPAETQPATLVTSDTEEAAGGAVANAEEASAGTAVEGVSAVAAAEGTAAGGGAAVRPEDLADVPADGAASAPPAAKAKAKGKAKGKAKATSGSMTMC